MSTDAYAPPKDSKKRRRVIFYYLAVCLILLIVAIIVWLLYFRFRAYTDDAYVEGNQVFITPLRPGFIQAIHTDDTFLVEQGKLLIEMDRTDSLIALDQAKENLAQTVRNVCELFHQVFVYSADIEVKKAELIKAAQDYEHRQNVLEQGGVSVEDWEHAVAALRANFYSFELTDSLYDKALSLVQGTSIAKHPLVLIAADKVREAWVQLYRCNIYSPVEGLAAQRSIQVGMWVKAGDPLLSVIPLDQIWVNANFKETQLRHMRIGQKVKLTSDLYGRDVVYHGKIVGLPGAAGNSFSLLPPENLTGNWIKIVQRLPVRVEIDKEELKKHPLRIGLSMEATADLRESGELVPTSSKGSPTYQTTIFAKEEIGDRELIQKIIAGNLDPTLKEYADAPLYITKAIFALPDVLKEDSDHAEE